MRKRIKVSMNEDLIAEVDELVEEGIYWTRSHAFEALIRRGLKADP